MGAASGIVSGGVPGVRWSLKGRRVVVYLRISRDPEQQRKGVLLQREYVVPAVEAAGGVVVAVVEDNDTSAYRKRRVRVSDGDGGFRWAWRVVRPGWERGLALVRAGEADALLVSHVDRLTRDPRDLEDAIEVVEHFRAAVIDVAESLDLSTDHGIFIARMLVAHANLSSRDTSRRARRRHVADAQEGKPHHGRRPYGWTARRAGIVEEEATRLRDACKRLLEGASPYTVLAEWVAEGAQTVSGKRWMSATFRSVLTNPAIAGYASRQHREVDPVTQVERRWWEIVRREDGSEVQGQWDGIVSRQTWEAVCGVFGLVPGGPPVSRAGTLTDTASDAADSAGGAEGSAGGSVGEGLRDDPLRGRPGSRGACNTRRHLLSGLARCAQCGAGMVGGPVQGQPGRHQYRCPGPANGGCGGVSRMGDRLDAYVVEAALAKYEAELAAYGAESSDQPDAAQWQGAGRLAVVERKLGEAYRAWKADQLGAADYFSVRADLEATRVRLRREEAEWHGARARLEAPRVAGPVDVRSAWHAPVEDGGLTLVAKRDFLFTQLAAVEVLRCPVDPVTGKVRRRWDPANIRLIWRATAGTGAGGQTSQAA